MFFVPRAFIVLKSATGGDSGGLDFHVKEVCKRPGAITSAVLRDNI